MSDVKVVVEESRAVIVESAAEANKLLAEGWRVTHLAIAANRYGFCPLIALEWWGPKP